MKCDPDTLAYLQLLESKVNDLFGKTSTGPGGLFFAQGGNAFGAAAILGTTDNNSLTIETDGGVANVMQLGQTGRGIGIGVPAPVGAGTITVQAAAQLNLTGGAASQLTTSAGALTITSAAGATWSTAAGALTITSAAAATWSTAVGNLQLSAAGTINVSGTSTQMDTSGNGNVTVGASNAATITIGNTANTSQISVNVQAGQIATAASAIAGGGAIPATLNYLICTINGTARKIPFAAT